MNPEWRCKNKYNCDNSIQFVSFTNTGTNTTQGYDKTKRKKIIVKECILQKEKKNHKLTVRRLLFPYTFNELYCKECDYMTYPAFICSSQNLH